jgi:hypothetical protein
MAADAVARPTAEMLPADFSNIITLSQPADSGFIAGVARNHHLDCAGF